MLQYSSGVWIVAEAEEDVGVDNVGDADEEVVEAVEDDEDAEGVRKNSPYLREFLLLCSESIGVKGSIKMLLKLIICTKRNTRSHSLDHVSSLVAPNPRSFTGSAAPQVCSFFQQGRCTKGTSCPFLHVKVPKDLSVIPCVHFANGRCRNGDACPYAHGPVFGAKIASPSPHVNVAPGNSPTGKSTDIKPSSPVKVAPGNPLTIKPKDPGASSPAKVPSYNASTNKSEPSSAARLPTQIAVALLQHADTVKALTGVRVTRIGNPQIPSGVCLIGPTAQLPFARAALIRLGDPDGCLAVQRVLCSRFRFLAIMDDELEMARILWKGRRVVLSATGGIASIEGLRIEHSSKGDVIIMLDVCEQNAAGQPTTKATLPATEAVCWDVQDLPDTVDVTHADFGNEVLCAAQLRRAFEVVGSVEAVHRVCQTKAGTIVSRVILAACVDPLSPANAVATLDGSFLAGKMLTVRVGACNSVQRGPGANGLRKSCHATAKALVLKLEVEEHAEALKAKREAARKAASDAASDSDPSEVAASVAPSEDSSSTASRKQPALSRTEAHKALSTLMARLQGPDADKEMAELATELRKVIRGTWLRHRPRGVCGFHRSFELGRGPACEHGVACRYNHYLAPCRDGDKCKKGNRCCFVHPKDCARLRRLDVHLDKHLGLPADASADLPALLKALSKHRVAMEEKAMQLLEAAHQREASMATDIHTEEKRDCTTAAEAAQKVATIEAMRGKALELSKQVAEYDRSLQTFLVADPQSFRAARVFARETYNRFPTCLPVYAERATIQDALREDFAVLILSAETGSGKSTQVVQYLHEMLPGRRVLCTQPRRVAAATLTERVAEELQTTPPTAEGPNLVACSAGGGVRTDTADAKVLWPYVAQFCCYICHI